jgi:methionyl-tRNA synthetase
MAERTFYITTPIYYPSDRLHIGHAYTTVAADALARWHRKRGEDVFFLTGTDEHGQKIERRAREAGKDPQAFVDEIVAGIKELWRLLHISYDDFIRTTEPRHVRVVQAVFRRLEANGDLYLGRYEGWYCTPCETFWLESRLVDGRCPDCGRPVERVAEESYFFRLSKYQDRLLRHIEEHPDFIQPVTRRNEMIAFIRQGLEDLSVSRASFRWGIPLPQDPRHVAYVWIDALTNYITAVGYESDPEKFRRYWPADVHLVGKEIVRFHAVIWPILLMALDLPLPKRVFGHGWLLIGESKMSKSKGNVIDPAVLVARYGVDPIRYYLLREVPFGQDGSYTEDALVLRTNVDLANDLGNLLSRTTAMIERFASGVIPAPNGPSYLRSTAEEAIAEMEAHLEALRIPDALAALWRLVDRANKLIEEKAPWELRRRQDPELGTVLYDLAEALRVVALALTPFLVEAPAKIWAQLGLDGDVNAALWSDLAWGGTAPGTRVRRGEPIFPRIAADEGEAAHASGSPAEKAEVPPVDIGEFRRIDLRVAEVVAAERVAGTDRLLKLELDLGQERRTVVSGIAERYRPEDLVGRKVVLVANLKPAVIRGIRSQGMILAATDEEGLALLTVDRPVAPGSPVS